MPRRNATDHKTGRRHARFYTRKSRKTNWKRIMRKTKD